MLQNISGWLTLNALYFNTIVKSLCNEFVQVLGSTMCYLEQSGRRALGCECKRVLISLNMRLPQASSTRVTLRMLATFTFSAAVRAKTMRLVFNKAGDHMTRGCLILQNGFNQVSFTRLQGFNFKGWNQEMSVCVLAMLTDKGMSYLVYTGQQCDLNLILAT